MSNVFLSVLSAWTFKTDAGEVAVKSRKGRALITYVYLTNGAVSRRTLSDLLWDGADHAKAQTSLRQVLSGLKTTLAAADLPILTATAEDVSLDRTRVHSDLDQLWRSIDAGLPDGGAVEQVEVLLTSLGHLSGLTAAFDDWVSTTRARLAAETLDRLAATYSDDTLEAGKVNRAARAALILDDHNETAARTAMRSHVAMGNSALALRIYGDLYERLADDLDAEPSAETQALAVEIKMAAVDPPAAKISTPAPPKHAETKRTPQVSIAVLPFDVFSDAEVPPYLALGLLDQITCRLASYQMPAVISSNSTRGYLGAVPSLDVVQRELMSTYVVTGSVLVDRETASIAVQLVEVGTGLVKWAGSFDVARDGIFAAGMNLAERIAQTVIPNLNLSELRQVQLEPVGMLGPYHLVLKAKDQMFQLDHTAFLSAGELLQQAVAADQTYAPAHALLAEWYALRLWQGWSDQPKPDERALLDHATRAVSLAPGDGRSVALMAHCKMMFGASHQEALTLFDQAQTLFPNDAETLAWSVPTLSFAGQSQLAVENGTRAVALSPLDPFQFRNEHFLSIAHFMNGSYDESADLGLSCFERSPEYSSNLRMTIAALTKAGRSDEAVPLVEHHGTLLPDFSVARLMANHGLRDPAARQAFGDVLLSAGLPA